MKKKSKPQNTSHTLLAVLLITLLFVNSIVIILIAFFFILTRFTEVNSSHAKYVKPVNFSYFTKRPDLLSSSKALVVYDAASHVTLLSKNQNLRFSPASTAKIMTALVALDNLSPSQILTVSALPESSDSSKMGLFLGEKISVLNLLYGMLLPSGGDAAETLAASIPGGREEFISQMNKKAKSIGLSNTYFVDPSGYSDENYTTATDLSRLGAYALQNQLISQIVQTKKITIFDLSGTIPHVMTNLNELLEIPGVTGIKTGFTNEAEGVLTTSFIYQGKKYIIVVLGSKDRFQDTTELIEGIITDLKSESLSLN